MIIQAGFDLEFLARLLIAPAGEVLPRLVLIELDADMQFGDIALVSCQFDGRLKPHYDTILGHLDQDSTRYFAIAHAGCWPECADIHEPVLVEAEELRELALHRGFVMIGHFGLDDAGYMSNGPHYYFDRYRLGLPCTMDHWVHSKHGKCG
jgi:hypothetical protein